MKLVLKGILVLAAFLIIAFVYSNYKFQQAVDDKVQEIFKDLPVESGKKIAESDLAYLPPLMKNYLKESGLIGMPYTNKVKLNQVGRIRLKPNGKWLNFTAVQYYRLDNPAFVWSTTIKMFGIPIIKGMDVYQDGKGSMKIKVMPFFTVVDAKGPDMNTGSHSRYTNEIMWFPQMYLSNQMSYVQKSDNIVELKFSDEGIETIADLEIVDNKITNFVCDRFYMNDESSVTRKWSTPINKWQELSGLMLPVGGHAEWDLEDGRFKYIEIEIKSIEY